MLTGVVLSESLAGKIASYAFISDGLDLSNSVRSSSQHDSKQALSSGACLMLLRPGVIIGEDFLQ